MTDRALTMLSQYLVSNQSLKLDSSFKVYLKVLSIEHMRSSLPRRNNKRKFTGKLHVGIKNNETIYNPKWAFDVSATRFSDQLKSTCLLVCTILSLLQNNFFKTEGVDSRYKILCNLRSKSKKQQNIAFEMLEQELNKLFSVVKINRTGPYQLKSTVVMLHEVYKCQFFIFSGLTNASKLCYSYPEEYNDALVPIFLFNPANDPEHVIFIKNLNFYFGSNFSFCLACKRSFKSKYNSHICRVKASCYTCRKLLLSPSTYVHQLLISNFCDKNISANTLKACEICNLNIYSERCLKNHRKICNGKGKLGYFCPKCHKLIQGSSSLDVKLKHNCVDRPLCKYCFLPQESGHLCTIKKEKVTNENPRFAFLNVELFYDSEEICLANIYVEGKRCIFENYKICHPDLSFEVSKPEMITVNYLPNNVGPIPFQDKRIITHSVLKANLQLLKMKTTTCLDKLLNFILNPDLTGTTYICQDYSFSIFMVLLKGFIDNGICPNVVRKGREILLLEIPHMSIRILNSNNFIKGNEFEIAQLFNFSNKPIYFPYKFLIPENLNYADAIPDFLYFHNFSDSSEILLMKRAYHEDHQKNIWKLSNELLSYSDIKLLLLTKTMCEFVKECYTLQIHCMFLKPQHEKKFFHPFTKPLCTLGGFVSKLFKFYFLNEYPIYTVNFEYGFKMHQVSALEYQFTSFKEYMNPEEKFLSAFNNENGQKKFQGIIPDLYSITNNELYCFNGCFVHGHICHLNKNKTADSPHPFGSTYKDIHDKFFQKLELCMNQNPEITKAHVVWECAFKEIKKTEQFKNFYKSHFIPHPLTRLKPRDTIRGGLSETFALKWSKTTFPNEKFYCLDYNGLFSYAATFYDFPIDKYKVVIGKDLQNISIRNNLFYYYDNHVTGSIMLTVLAPSNLEFPYLLYRKTNNSVVLTLCRSCSENLETDCTHSERQRSWVATYMLTEIEFALTLGYKIVAIHEMHVYEKIAPIFKEFVKFLNVMKLKATDCFKQQQMDKNKLCDDINEKMQLEGNERILVDDIQINDQKRNFYKLMANALFGKFIERRDRPQLRYASSQSDLTDLYYSHSRIEDLFCLSEHTCLVSINADPLKLPPNRKHNIYIGSQIIANARQIMYNYILKLKQTPDCKIYQIECDALFFTLPNHIDCPLPLSPCMGDFKHVYPGEIVNFYSLGQKQYCINFLKDGVLNSVHKISGLAVNCHYNSSKLRENSFEIFLDNLLNGKNCSSTFLQQKFRSDFINLKVLSYQQKYTLTNKLSLKRFVNVYDDRLSTYPFGYNVK